MLRIVLAAMALTLSAPAVAQQCGWPPYPPYGMEQCKQICVCDANGTCSWRYECTR